MNLPFRPCCTLPSTATRVRPVALGRTLRRACAAALSVLAILATSCQSAPQPTPNPAPPAPSPQIAASLVPSPSLAVPSPSPASPTATPVPTPVALAEYPFGVTIDNSPDARPHVGLDHADVVYDVPSEAGISRLLAVFLRDAPNRVGPVRSARDYFVYLAAEYGVALVHFGASPQGFVAIEQTALPRIDGALSDAAISRDPRRAAPHDAMLSPELARTDLDRRRVSMQPSMGGLTYGDPPPGPNPGDHLRLVYPGYLHYQVAYDYDAASKTYARSMDGRPHRDGDSGAQYVASSVIVQNVSITPIPNDNAGRVYVDLLSSGEGFQLVDGTQVPLRWHKASIRDVTHFERQDGEPFTVPDGPVWIHLVPLETEVQVS